MAGTLAACPREESAFSNDGASRNRQVADPLPGGATVCLLLGAALLHGAALAFAIFHPVSLPSLVILGSGLIVTLIALRVAQIATRSDNRSSANSFSSVTTDLSPPLAGSGGSPSPLPFIGERIAVDLDTVHLPGLARAAARLRRTSSTRAHPWGDLMARVSHELRTPLNAVIGFSDVMGSELLGPMGHPRYREYVRHIGDCGRDLLKSAEDTLAITYLLDHDPTVPVATGVDLKAVMEEAWAFHCGPNASHGLELDARIPQDVEVLVEERPMRQILINLFAEAVRRADARGSVGVVATVDGDLVQVEVFLRGQPGEVGCGQASLPICLARALLELNGASLIEVDDPYSTWRAVTVLRCIAQCDFFASLPEPAMLRQPSVPACEAACA